MPATRRLVRQLTELAAVGAVYIALAIWWLWPLPTAIRTHSAYFLANVPLIAADYHLIVWAMAWDAHALVTAPWNLFHANAFYPSADALAYSEHFLGYAPLFAPTYWATRNPVFAANLTIFATYPLCGLATYLLARRFTSRPGAALAGFFYAFYLGRYHALPHFHLLGVHWLPLALLATERWLDAARSADVALLALALLLQALSSFYLAFALAVAYVPYFALALWRWRGRLDRQRLLGLAAAFTVVAVAIGVSGLPYLRLRRLGLIPSYEIGDESTPMALMAGVGGLRVWYFLFHLSVGPVGYALAATALLPPWRAQGGVRRTVLAMTLVGTVAAFGTGIPFGTRTLWTPYALLARWIPGASTVRMPARFVVVTQLGLALLAGLGFARLLGRPRPALGWVAAAVVATLALATFRPFPSPPLVAEPTGERVPPAYRWLADHGEGRALLEEPAGTIVESARRMLLSTYHWLPIVDGYSAYPPASSGYLHGIAAALPSEAALQTLADTVDLGWILVHRGQMTPAKAAAWNDPLPAGLERVAEWDADLLVRVTRTPRDDRRALLLSTSETLHGVALAPFGDRCPGAIVVRSAPPSPWPSPGIAHVEIDVRNDGADPWPAFGFVPRHLVRLQVCLARPGDGPCSTRPIGLPADVPAGGAVSVAIDQLVPLIPGRYALRLSLVQIGDGPLARCGVAPLDVPIEVLPPRFEPPSPPTLPTPG
jgi:hypothetical protein